MKVFQFNLKCSECSPSSQNVPALFHIHRYDPNIVVFSLPSILSMSLFPAFALKRSSKPAEEVRLSVLYDGILVPLQLNALAQYLTAPRELAALVRNTDSDNKIE